jgi:hypothetical protein
MIAIFAAIRMRSNGHCQSQLPPIMGHRGQLQEVMVNLIYSGGGSYWPGSGPREW